MSINSLINPEGNWDYCGIGNYIFWKIITPCTCCSIIVLIYPVDLSAKIDLKDEGVIHYKVPANRIQYQNQHSNVSQTLITSNL